MKFARSLSEAFPAVRFPAVEVYRAGWLSRWWRPISNLIFIGTVFGGTGVAAFYYLSR